jgi:hypothetical protein
MPFGVQIEKDPQIQQLLSNVFEQLSEIRDEVEPYNLTASSDQIKFVSFEDALKDLVTQKQA